jgi:predicted site-specific integrase-resolvase
MEQLNIKYVGGKEASKILGVHQRTLYQWEEKKLIETIRTPGGKRLYNVSKYLEEHNDFKNKKEDVAITSDEIDENDFNKIKEKLNICYVRVSSLGQKDDLNRQKEFMKKKYPKHIIIEDIGSGLNLNKRGIKKIIKLGISGKINELVVAYKDRLTRFGFELIEEIIKDYSNGNIIILNEKEEIEPEEELVKDLMSLMNVYVAKMNGLRKYKKKI